MGKMLSLEEIRGASSIFSVLGKKITCNVSIAICSRIFFSDDNQTMLYVDQSNNRRLTDIGKREAHSAYLQICTYCYA
ncbi:hypothetical protein ACSQ67_002012 [Phaseolus vulgaris]